MCVFETLRPQANTVLRLVPGPGSGTDCVTTLELPHGYRLNVEPVKPLFKEYYFKICLDGTANILILKGSSFYNAEEAGRYCTGSWFDFTRPQIIVTKLKIINTAARGYFHKDNSLLIVNGKPLM